MRPRFRFRAIPFVATVLLVALGIALGNWQTRRAAEKAAQQARLAQRAAAAPLALDGAALDPDAVEFRRVVADGSFRADWPLYLDNRPGPGGPGFILLMPFTIAGSDRVVLVERGWLPRAAEHDRVPAVATPAGPQRIEGILVRRPGRVMQLGAPAPLTPGAIVQNLDPADFARASGLAVMPVVVDQTGEDAPAGRSSGQTQARTPASAPAQASAPALVRRRDPPGSDVARHRGYAFQWYALAAMAFVFFVVTGFRSGCTHGSTPAD